MATSNSDLRIPFAEWEEVTVTFSATANADSPVNHHVLAADPESLNYIVVKADRAVRVYNDTSATRKKWATGTAYLRADVASAVVTLLLYVSHVKRTPSS